MTIRFQCDECDSVLKIKDELAGTKAKCPKCRKPFVIPQPSSAAKKVAAKKVAAAKKKVSVPEAGPGPDFAADAPRDSLDDLIDMPREVTPRPQLAAGGAFDPMDILGDSGERPVPAASVSEATAEQVKPSVADLMREHQAAMEAKKSRRASRKPAATESAESKQFTSGTASEALSRSYDQKREKAGEPAPMTREEQREIEYKQARNEFAVKAAGGLAALGVVLYFLTSWLFGPSLPDLEYVTGVIKLNGAPAEGLSVTFSPVDQGEKGGLASPSTAYTDSSGTYVLKFRQDIEGAVPGKHRVILMDSSGFEFNLPTNLSEVTVVAGESNTIDFEL